MSARVVLLIATTLATACTTATGGPRASAAPASVAIVTEAPASAEPSSFETPGPSVSRLGLSEYPVGKGQGPHDVAPAADGGVWYTAQRTGELGRLDPKTGAYRMIKLGAGSAPHGVIVGPDGNPWVTDGGLNAIVRVDAKTSEITRFPLPADRPNANLNTATFDTNGTLWFTGQSGVYGRLDPRTGAMAVFDSPRGPGPYGMATCPDGRVYYASLAGSFIGRIDVATGQVEVIEPPTRAQGARRVWCDTRSGVWISEWNTGRLALYSPPPSGPPVEQQSTPVPSPAQPPTSYGWIEWTLPASRPMAYAVYVDDQDIVWVTDFGANALLRFDPTSQTFTAIPLSGPDAAVRQLLGRPGEVWGAMSGLDKLLVVRTR
jgi:virginiamycin B lyase